MPTLFDKIWDSHVVGQREDGRVLVYMDRNVIHDLHAPHAFAKLRAAGRVARRPELTVAVTDHTVIPAPTARPRATRRPPPPWPRRARGRRISACT
jgi:homoaconitase/3-isopropylmalate dehydratase large subunit